MRNSVHGTPEQFEAALKHKIQELGGNIQDDVTSTIEIDDNKERYIHTLIGDIQSEFKSTVDSMKFDTTDDSLIITAVLGNTVKEFTVPYSDLKFDWDDIDVDTQYISNAIDEEFNREYVDDVISESSVNSRSSKFGKVLGYADSNVSDFIITEDFVLVKYNGPGGDIVIPNSVQSIGDKAFSSCKNLTSITIPGSVKNIGASAFAMCDNLTTVAISSGVKSIGDMAFAGCKNLTNVTIPDSVKSIGEYAFRECDKLPKDVKNYISQFYEDDDNEYNNESQFYEDDDNEYGSEMSFEEWYDSSKGEDDGIKFVDNLESLVKSNYDVDEFFEEPSVQGYQGGDFIWITLSDGSKYEFEFDWYEEQLDIYTYGPEATAKSYFQNIQDGIDSGMNK